MKILLRAALVVLFASASMACAGVHARTLPEGPPLDVPPPPALIIEPFESEPDLPAAQPSGVPADAKPARRTPRATLQRSAPATRIEKPDKTEPLPATPAKPAADAAPPAALLQTTARVGELEKKIRTTLTGAARDLDRIDVRTLSVDGRAQYDEARRFAEQAEAALKVKNLAFAEQLADKAATLAGLLAKRHESAPPTGAATSA
ncbi:MAG: hypothetical protein NTV05_01835 [Acidobacteria bacterium]|nr:hypothetical protein [Acidobacteriota bacterium]